MSNLYQRNYLWKLFSTLSISLWLLLFALLPFAIMLVTSFLTYDPLQLFNWHFTLANYQQLFDGLYFKVFLRSFSIALLCTFICLLIAYPFTYWLSCMTNSHKTFLLLLVIIPFWTSSLIRTYAMIALLKAQGVINTILLTLGIIHSPLNMLYTNYAVIIGLVYNLLPFMIIPLYANMQRLDNHLIEAARDLGANGLKILYKILLPLTLPGILAGCILVFLPAITLFYIPDILGGAKSLLLGNLLQNQFLIMQNWPFGAAVNVVLTIVMALLVIIYWYNSNQRSRRDIL